MENHVNHYEDPRLRLVEKNPEIKFRLLGVSLIILEIGCMVVYGLIGAYSPDTSLASVAGPHLLSLVLMGLFTIVGYGLLLSSYKNASWFGFAVALITVAISIQLSPLLQKFWFWTFNTSFTSSPAPSDVGLNIQDFWTYYGDQKIHPSFATMRTTLLSCISILTLMTSVIGRVTFSQVVSVVCIYQLAWSINWALLIYMCVAKRDFNPGQFHNPYFFDAFGSTFVYLFAGAFGITYSCLLSKAKFPADSFNNYNSRFTLTLSHMGTGFIFATFIFTYNILVSYSSRGSNVAIFAMLFSLIGSVAGTYVGSALAGKGRVGYKEALVGTICGGIAMSGAAPLIDNIGLQITVGFTAGFLAGIYMRTIHVSLNKNYIKDAMGLFGPFMFTALLASMVLVPASLAYYFNNDRTLPTLTDPEPNVPKDLIGWQLVYVGITFGIGIAGGLVAVLLAFAGASHLSVGTNQRFFSNDYGLWSPSVFFEAGGQMETQNQLRDKELQ